MFSSMFQFRNGSIKRAQRTGWNGLLTGFNSEMVRLKGRKGLRNLRRCIRFNSEMVRLKGNQKPLQKGISFCFNSEMVRLKAVEAFIKENNLNCFNSEMVRLKERYEKLFNFVNSKFQFRNGSIKSTRLWNLD